MDKALAHLWAKTDKSLASGWHPLILHLLDVAATASVILERETEVTRARMGQILGLDWCNAEGWILLLIACHDLGKCCPGFQSKWPQLLVETRLSLPRVQNHAVNHAFVSQIALVELLTERGWASELAELAASAVGCHHGSRASPRELERLQADYRGIGRDDWTRARSSLFESLLELFKPLKTPTKDIVDGPDFMLLAGLTSFADWIGSNEDWFPYAPPSTCNDLPSWFAHRCVCARRALDTIGWQTRTPLSPVPKSFDRVFGVNPRPLQSAVVDALHELTGPAVLLVEAPMGEGKTEAAFYAHLELQRCFGHRGLYVALPTKATGNAMFGRTLKFLRDQGLNRPLDLQLLHGGALLNDTFQNLRLTDIHDVDAGGAIRASEWFTHKKRALLSEYGVGTVDQALLPILPVRHNFVRLWGLANRVVIFDEIHAYDAYTGTLLFHLLRWLTALGASVVLLSATLPPSIRRKLAEAVCHSLPTQEVLYPRLTVLSAERIQQTHFESDPARHLVVQLKRIPHDIASIHAAVNAHLRNGGMGMALVNTVQRAQDLYMHFPAGERLDHHGQCIGKRLGDGTEVFLFHARFPADRRQSREDHILEVFGQKGRRDGKKVLIATQVAEQSLDLDFDLIVTDLAPIDLLLQRAGRLWRHARGSRAIPNPIFAIAGISEEPPPSFEGPLWWSAIYREDVLLRTWILLKTKEALVLPDEIDSLVQAVYEEQLAVPPFLQERMEKATLMADGVALAQRAQANQAIIGFPDDDSWNDPARFVLRDEDEPGIHRTLLAQTRLGEDAVNVIPLWHHEKWDAEATPEFSQAKEWYLRALNLSRKRVVKELQDQGVPEGWKKSPLLRNCFPLVLDAQQRWIGDPAVKLDDDLGLVYGEKEKE